MMENENQEVQVLPAEVQNDADTILSGNEVAAPNDTSEGVLSPDPVAHPLMTTSFSDYTVTEGLLLLILLTLLIGGVVSLVKGVL